MSFFTPSKRQKECSQEHLEQSQGRSSTNVVEERPEHILEEEAESRDDDQSGPFASIGKKIKE